MISLVQTLTSLQDQTISTVPRLLIVVGLLMAALPWFLARLMSYTIGCFRTSIGFWDAPRFVTTGFNSLSG